MATKVKQLKKIKSTKNPEKNKAVKSVPEDTEDETDIISAKPKKVGAEIEMPDPVIDIEEKIDPEVVVGVESEEEEDDEETLSIDEEEINPFGDKWEM